MLSWDIARRFRRSKHQNRFIGFVSASSTLGIALGCAVLILLLSVMNGFERELKDRLLALIPHGELEAVEPQGLTKWNELAEQIRRRDDVIHVQPYVKASGLIQKGRKMSGVQLSGVDSAIAKDSAAAKFVTEEHWLAFENDPDGVLLGARLVANLGIDFGDKVQLLLPRPTLSGRLQAPISHWFTLRGSIAIGGQTDSVIGLAHIKALAQLSGTEQGAQGLELSFKDPFEAPRGIRDIGYQINQQIYMSDWTRTQGHLYQDIQLVRGVVYLVLTLVIAVACFNIVSTLVMAVKEKQGEIAILKTMGAENGLIASVFVWQGAINGIIGSALGCGTGVVVALNLSDWVRSVEQWLNISLLSGDIYFINFLPTELNMTEVAITAAVALSLSLLSTLYPALQAAKVQPANVLGH